MEKDIEINALTQKVKEIIKKSHDVTGGACGISPIVVTAAAGTDWKTLEPVLKQLHEEKYFKVRKGINGKLYFYNEPK